MPPSTTRRLVGLLLLLPALVLLTVSYLQPTAWTVLTSLRRLDVLTLDSRGGVGTANYRSAVRDGLWPALGYALSLGVVPLVLLLTVAPALAYAAHRTGTAARLVTRVALGVPLAAYAPTAMALAWWLERPALPAAPQLATALRAAHAYTTAGPVVAVGVTLYLAALRRRDPDRPTLAAVLVVGALAVLGAGALALQELAYPLTLTGGAPAGRTRTPLLQAYQLGAARASLGPAAAVLTVLLAFLALAGLAATVLVVASGLRVEVDERYASADAQRDWPAPRVVALVATAVLVCAVLAVSAAAALPWLRGIGGGEPPPGVQEARVLANTWLPPLLTTVVGVGAALAGAVGIAILRPLDRFSEWLLLPFGPWLFVGLGPLALPAFAVGRTADRLESWLGLLPPTWLVIPALFVFTLLLRGEVPPPAGDGPDVRQPWGPARFGGYLRAVAPMVALVTGVSWLVQAQAVAWTYLTGTDPRLVTGPALLARWAFGFAPLSGPPPYRLALPVPVLALLLVAAVAAQLGYLDRVAVRVGRRAPAPANGPRVAGPVDDGPASGGGPGARGAPRPVPGDGPGTMGR
jgi:ABC-type sugar transport system permease subunit